MMQLYDFVFRVCVSALSLRPIQRPLTRLAAFHYVVCWDGKYLTNVRSVNVDVGVLDENCFSFGLSISIIVTEHTVVLYPN